MNCGPPCSLPSGRVRQNSTVGEWWLRAKHECSERDATRLGRLQQGALRRVLLQTRPGVFRRIVAVKVGLHLRRPVRRLHKSTEDVQLVGWRRNVHDEGSEQGGPASPSCCYRDATHLLVDIVVADLVTGAFRGAAVFGRVTAETAPPVVARIVAPQVAQVILREESRGGDGRGRSNKRTKEAIKNGRRKEAGSDEGCMALPSRPSLQRGTAVPALCRLPAGGRREGQARRRRSGHCRCGRRAQSAPTLPGTLALCEKQKGCRVSGDGKGPKVRAHTHGEHAQKSG